MLKDYLEKNLKNLEEQRANCNAAMIDADEKEKRAALGEALTQLEAEIAEARKALEEADEPAEEAPAATEEDARSFKPLATMEGRNQAMVDNALEVRNAFKDYIVNGKIDKYNEVRSAAGNTTTGDNVGTVIPENLINQIMEKIESVGTIYNLVTKTAFAVGQTIPREATKPVATWVGRNTTTLSSSTNGEGNGSTVQKGVTLSAAISFTSFKLRCEVAMTEEVANMTLSAFEALFVKNVSLAMLRAIEWAIVDGDGKGQPTGILNETAPSGQALEIAATGALSYEALCEAEAAIPAEYEAGAKWCMTKKTFMQFVAMVDDNGQPIARVNYGIAGKPERTLLGRDVVLYVPQSGSKLGNYASTVETDTVFAFIFDFADYTLNTNYDLGIQHKIDWDNEDHRTKAVAAYDGKVIDNGSLVTITKKAAAAGGGEEEA